MESHPSKTEGRGARPDDSGVVSAMAILRQLTSRIGVRFHINTHRAQEFAQEGHDFRWINLKRTIEHRTDLFGEVLYAILS